MAPTSMLAVQRKPCVTCIYRRESPFDLASLEAQCADPRMRGFFLGYRVCHHSADPESAVCAGFWARHKDHCTAGQVAQRLGLVAMVDVDVFREKKG
jgi:hypothetical protein